MAIGTWKWKKILEGQGIKLSFWELFRYYLAGFSVMFLAPALLLAGEVFRGYALKKKNDIPGSKVMTSVFIDRSLEWLTNSIVAFFGILFFLYTIGVPLQSLVILFVMALLVFTGCIFFLYSKFFKKGNAARLFLKASGLKNFNHKNAILDAERTIVDFFKLKKEPLGSILGLSFLRAVVMYFRAWLLIIFLGKSIGALPIVTVLGFSYLATAVPIPAALGSHEALQVLAFNSLGLGSSTATAFTMIIRAAELLFALLGIVILFRLGVILLKKFLFQRVDKLASLISKKNS